MLILCRIYPLSSMIYLEKRSIS